MPNSPLKSISKRDLFQSTALNVHSFGLAFQKDIIPEDESVSSQPERRKTNSFIMPVTSPIPFQSFAKTFQEGKTSPESDEPGLFNAFPETAFTSKSTAIVSDDFEEDDRDKETNQFDDSDDECIGMSDSVTRFVPLTEHVKIHRTTGPAAFSEEGAEETEYLQLDFGAMGNENDQGLREQTALRPRTSRRTFASFRMKSTKLVD
jgi:hypothetical protein